MSTPGLGARELHGLPEPTTIECTCTLETGCGEGAGSGCRYCTGSSYIPCPVFGFLCYPGGCADADDPCCTPEQRDRMRAFMASTLQQHPASMPAAGITAQAVLDALIACAEDSTVEPKPFVDGFDLATVFVNGEINLHELVRRLGQPLRAPQVPAVDWPEAMARIEYEHVRRNNQATLFQWDVDGYGMDEGVRDEYRRAVAHQVNGLIGLGVLPPIPVEVSQ